jgi:hypothetical protein
MKKFFYIILLGAMMLIFLGCRNSSDVEEFDIPPITQSVPAISMYVSENLCADQETYVKVNVSQGASGSLLLMLSSDNGKTWNVEAETERCKSENEFYILLPKGSYLLKAVLKSDLSGCESESFKRIVSDCIGCEELFLEPNLCGDDFLVPSGEKKRFSVEYYVTACGEKYTELNLNGSLINNAVYVSSYPEGAEVIQENNLTVITWNIGNVKKDFNQIYVVTFDYFVPERPSGTHIPLTGSWILSGTTIDGLNVSAGNYNEIYVQIDSNEIINIKTDIAERR